MNKKVSIIFIVILALLILLVVFFLKKDNSEVENKIGYLIVNNDSFWKYQNDEWSKESKKDLSEPLDVFVNNRFFGNYYFRYLSAWNLFDTKNDYVNYNGNLIATSKELNASLVNYTKSEIDNSDLKTIINILNRSVSISDLSNNEKVITDLDNNGSVDAIISVSNIDSANQSNYFNLVYVILNGQTKILINDDVPLIDRFIVPLYSINGILSFNNSIGKYIIIEKGYFSNVNKTGNIMYELKNNDYNVVIAD